MASIAVRRLLNAFAFIGGNYLASAISGNGEASLQEKIRHDKALEAYQAAYNKYMENHNQLLDWIATQDRLKEQAKQDLINSDYFLKLYNLRTLQNTV